ncbi:hypothetical protein ACOMHN_027603 [Nucella lapillus]
MRERAGSLRIDEVSLVNELSDIELEMEFKEKRRDNLKRRSAVSEHGEPSAETWESLTQDLKALKERYPGVVRTLGQVKLKLTQVDCKLAALDKVHTDIRHNMEQLKEAEEDRAVKEQEFAEIEEAAQLARKVLLCKTANDATEKLFYSVPFGTKTAKAKGEVAVFSSCKSFGTQIDTVAKCTPALRMPCTPRVVHASTPVHAEGGARIDTYPMSRVVRLVSSRIERDWVALYRHLPFHPPRGHQTIQQDLVHLQQQGARVSLATAACVALDRWRRHHTRANVEDLRQALRSIKRLDILKAMDRGLQAPPKVLDPFENRQEAPPPVEPKLVPYYRLIERYDQIRASKAKS